MNVRNEKLLYSKEEAAALIGLSVHTITRDIRLGRIKAQRYGRRVLIPHAELMRIAAEGMPAVNDPVVLLKRLTEAQLAESTVR